MHYTINCAVKDLESARDTWNMPSGFWNQRITIHDKSVRIYLSTV